MAVIEGRFADTVVAGKKAAELKIEAKQSKGSTYSRRDARRRSFLLSMPVASVEAIKRNKASGPFNILDDATATPS